MLSKIKEYFFGSNDQSNEPSSNGDAFSSARYQYEEEVWASDQSNSSKTETSDEYDPYGANRWDHVDKYDLNQVKQESQKFIYSQGKQFVGGLAAGVYYTATGEPLVNPPADNIYKQGNRQEFADKLAEASENPKVKASSHAMDSAKVMQGQNYAQEAQGEPMPKNTIPIFINQIHGHAELDEKAREEGKPSASVNAHKNWDITCHEKHQNAFWNAGYVSGSLLHWIAGKKETMSKEGELEFPQTCSNDDPIIWHEHTEDDYDRMRSSGHQSGSETEDDSVVEEVTEEVAEKTEEGTAEKTVDETNSVSVTASECSSSFFSGTTLSKEDDKTDLDYICKWDTNGTF